MKCGLVFVSLVITMLLVMEVESLQFDPEDFLHIMQVDYSAECRDRGVLISDCYVMVMPPNCSNQEEVVTVSFNTMTTVGLTVGNIENVKLIRLEEQMPGAKPIQIAKTRPPQNTVLFMTPILFGIFKEYVVDGSECSDSLQDDQFCTLLSTGKPFAYKNNTIYGVLQRRVCRMEKIFIFANPLLTCRHSIYKSAATMYSEIAKMTFEKNTCAARPVIEEKESYLVNVYINGNESSYCSGVLIDEYYVLSTTRKCLINKDDNITLMSDIRDYADESATVGGRLVQGDIPFYQLIKLKRQLPSGMPVQLARSRPQFGSIFNVSNDGVTGIDKVSGTYRCRQNFKQFFCTYPSIILKASTPIVANGTLYGFYAFYGTSPIPYPLAYNAYYSITIFYENITNLIASNVIAY